MPKRLRVAYLERCIGCYQCALACARINEKVLSVDRSSIFIRTTSGYEGGFVVVVCRGCTDPPCAAACPLKAIKPRNGGGGLIDREICDATKCGQECIAACTIPGAIRIDAEIQRAILCRQCGTCTKFCPTGVLTMEEPKGGF